jgi:ribosome-associated protein
MIEISDEVQIPESELDFVYARSSGPGGQNVNKVETKVTLLFDVGSSGSLSDHQKLLITERLRTRVSKSGVLRVTSQRHRSQAANQEAAIGRFIELVAEALMEQPERRPTRPSRRARAERLAHKRRRSRVKEQRSQVEWNGEH